MAPTLSQCPGCHLSLPSSPGSGPQVQKSLSRSILGSKQETLHTSQPAGLVTECWRDPCRWEGLEPLGARGAVVGPGWHGLSDWCQLLSTQDTASSGSLVMEAQGSLA